MEIKEKNMDSILMYRLGDFYEMFFDDAKLCSEELELVLTGRDCGLEERAPMCGVPYHSCESYIARLINKGFKVAICEQTEDPATAKGIVKREVVRVITPGTVIEDAMLEEGKNNYLASVFIQGNECGLCFIDASTGSVSITDIKGDGFISRLVSELGRFSPSEVLINESYKIHSNLVSFLSDNLSCRVSLTSDSDFEKSKNGEQIVKQFKVLSVEELKLSEGTVQTAALDYALKYLLENGIDKLSSVDKINHY